MFKLVCVGQGTECTDKKVIHIQTMVRQDGGVHVLTH